MVIVTNDKGYNTFYYDLVEVSIKTNERVYKDAVIGVSASDEIKIVFSKDESKLSYEEIKLFYE